MLKRDLKNKISTESNDIESIDIRDLEELSAAIESDMVVVDEASTVLTTVENQVETLNENIDTMSPMEIGRAIGAIETNLDRVSNDTTTVDTESIGTVKRDLEAISDSIKKAWEAVKQFFRAVWAKIKKYYYSFMIWLKNDTRKLYNRVEDLLSTAYRLRQEYEEDHDLLSKKIADEIGNSLLFHNLLLIPGNKAGVIDNKRMANLYVSFKSFLTEIDSIPHYDKEPFWDLYKTSYAEYSIPASLPTDRLLHMLRSIDDKGFEYSKFVFDRNNTTYLEYINSSNSITEDRADIVRPLIAANIINNPSDYMFLFRDLLALIIDHHNKRSLGDLIATNEILEKAMASDDIDRIKRTVISIPYGDDIIWVKPNDGVMSDADTIEDVKTRAFFINKTIKGYLNTLNTLHNGMSKYVNIIDKYMIPVK